jgi:thiol-disulfide isomerase/thioredoxin
MHRLIWKLVVAIVAALAINTSVAATSSLDLELPQLRSDQFFRLPDTHGRVVVVNFWDTECPPCVREMPLLDKMAKYHPDTLFIGVTVSKRKQAQDFLEEHLVSYLQLLGPADPTGILRRFGDPYGVLPHTVILHTDHSVCDKRSGEISQSWMESALARCR